LASLLLPLGLLFLGIVGLRRWFYRSGILSQARLPVPVVVVGNITAGGSGKTPLVIWLVERFGRYGRIPGVISRGYGGALAGVHLVSFGDTPDVVGDEPLLIARRTGCPLVVGRDRVAAARALLAEFPDCDVIISDDGLQHYRLARDCEIAVVDRRGFWNGWPLPAGPLREPIARLNGVDAVVANGWAGESAFRMTLAGSEFRLLGEVSRRGTPADLAGLRLHAVAGIGEPQRFFDHLSGLGLAFEPHPFPDHHAYAAGELDFVGDAILTTEKDAVKFGDLAKLPVWVLPVTAAVVPDLAQFILERIDGRPPA
jgi:tetraacyldisaccharide 4'-kinase